MKKRLVAMLLSAAIAASLLSMAACSGGTTAATMHLRRTEGTVSVSDGGGKDVPVLDNLGLYSGYGVNTRSASYAWIDLDDVKLAKLDQNSKITIEKEGKALDIRIRSGSLFFNVTEPLEDDETMNIRTSTMLVGIRGTSGWVEDNDGLSRVYLLEGKVECSAGDQTVRVNAGEFAELTADGELTVQEFPEQDLPTFVREEVDADLPGGLDKTPSPDGSDAPGSSSTPEPEPTPEPVGEVTYTFDEGTGVLTISGTGPIKSNSPWRNNSGSITEVVIEDGVTSIPYRAFMDCGSLERVTIPGSVTNIGGSAFANCSSLTSVTISEGVTGIGTYAFYNCSSLPSVTIPGSVTSIGESAFQYCSGLKSVTIPNGVTSIGGSAFAKESLIKEYESPIYSHN